MLVDVGRGFQWIGSTDFRAFLPVIAELLPALVALGILCFASLGTVFSLGTLLLSVSVLMGRRRPGGHELRRILIIVLAVSGIGMFILMVLGMWGDYLIFKETVYAHPVLQGIYLPILGYFAIVALPLLLAFRAVRAPGSVGLALGENAGDGADHGGTS
jgi:hypothetical protein